MDKGRQVETEAARRAAPKRSPAMEQFFRAKQAYPETILFFRLGDFYEMFFEDAVLASDLLDLTLTSRGNDEHGVAIPMAGVPYHAATGYIARLIEQGQRVAICEQMEDPSKVKGVVPREVVRVVTPGLLLEPDTLDARAHNYLACVASDGERFGLAVFELSTAEARACELCDAAEVLAELVRCNAREILLEPQAGALRDPLSKLLPTSLLRATTDAELAAASADPRLRSVLESATREQSFGALPLRAVTRALKYAQDSQPGAQLELQRIAPYDLGDQLLLDDAAVRSLELVSTLGGDRKGSLLHLLDVTKTAMGARLLRQRLLAPLTDIQAIRRRHDRVEVLREDLRLRTYVQLHLARIADLERLSTRATLGVATPRDLGAIASSLTAAAELCELLAEAASSSTDDTLQKLIPEHPCADLRARLRAALVDEPPLTAREGGIFRAEYDPRVAELRQLSEHGKDMILELERREREQTGITSLKVRFTRVFGYYIEITKSKLGTVPERYRRKQTVAGGERFTTEELEGLQTRILNADERLKGLEADLFEQLRGEVGKDAAPLKRLALVLGDLDVHAAMAEIAHRHDYVRPTIDDSLRLELEQGRHPIVERMVPSGRFVPNDISLTAGADRMMIITGPNMAGKSTAMRQVALAVIMAQAGAFVPASRGRIGIVDRIYTRVGASDNVGQGQSTFMVEMRETAAILKGASRRSLVILDEIGRGTSTYDGLAIAWSVAEHLHDAVACRTMFATHYHELCELGATRSTALNFNVAAREYGQEIVFLHKLVSGGANRSYGVAVAKLAGVPEIVVARARTLLLELESGHELGTGSQATLKRQAVASAAQLEIFAPEPRAGSEALATLRALDTDRMTPIDALVALARLKQML
jgi:DNA mismatch repair protein MutS